MHIPLCLFRILAISMSVVYATGLSSPLPAFCVDDIQEFEEQAMRSAVEKVSPSVVRIETVGGVDRKGAQAASQGPSSGVIISPDGYIISSSFSFASEPDSTLVTLPSGGRTSAEIIARDDNRKLVLLKIETTEPLPVPETVARSDLRVGQWTIAVGRTFDAQSPNISIGILSATNRIWGKAVQSDAKISPSNYGGPLIDIQGRVIGILVPLSPQSNTTFAGAEWYDSGIGFAVPLTELVPYLDKLKSGEDLKPGLLGITLKAEDMYADPAVIARVAGKSPAAQAGLQQGDEIVRINDSNIARHSELKHAIGPLYAGDRVQVTVRRDKDELTRELTLAAKIDPYVQPFIGILPIRSIEATELIIRYVFDASPAKQAGLKADDIIAAMNGVAVASAGQLHEQLLGHEPGEVIELTIMRGDTEIKAELTLGEIEFDLPSQLPPAHGKLPAPEPPGAKTGEIEIKLAEHSNACFALIPENYDASLPHGLTVWLPAPGKFDKQKIIDRFGRTCRRQNMVLLVPQSTDPTRWSSLESEFVKKAIDQVISSYNIEPRRVIVAGDQAGGAMAFLVAFGHRSVVRGVAALSAAIPRVLQPPATDPTQPLAVCMGIPQEDRNREAMEASAERLSTIKYPVTEITLGGKERKVSNQEFDQLFRWMDTLDRL